MAERAWWILSILLAAIGCVPPAVLAQAADVDAGTAFSGYYKNLLVRSETVVGGTSPYWLDLNRLRLEKKGRISDQLWFDVQYDNEVLVGSYIDTAQFRMQKAAATDQYWPLKNSYLDNPDLHARHLINRGYLSWSSGATDVRIGRQRIAWGSGKFWSPFDVLNPIQPTALEREERPGVDAVLAEYKLSAVSRVSAVFAPRRDHGDDALALQWHGNAVGIDFSLMAMRFLRARMLGAELAGQVGGAAVRAELTRTMATQLTAYTRAVFGVDYAFANTLALTGELYFNGGGARNRQDYDFPALFSGRAQSVARHYAGLHAAYDITPLLKLNGHLVINLDDGSRFVAPTLVYSWKTNLDLTAGIQYAAGSRGSEFDRFRNVVYVQLQRFF